MIKPALASWLQSVTGAVAIFNQIEDITDAKKPGILIAYETTLQSDNLNPDEVVERYQVFLLGQDTGVSSSIKEAQVAGLSEKLRLALQSTVRFNPAWGHIKGDELNAAYQTGKSEWRIDVYTGGI